MVRAASEYLVTSQKGLASLHEVALNKKFRVALEHEKNNRPKLRFAIELDASVFEDADSEDVAGKPDFKLKFEPDFDDPDRYLAMECKRVNGSRKDELDRQYVLNGVCRFVECKYGACYGWGIMVGYVIEGRTTKAAELIAERLKALPGDAGLVEELCAADDLADTKDVYSSRHTRPTKGDVIRLAHFLFKIPQCSASGAALTRDTGRAPHGPLPFLRIPHLRPSGNRGDERHENRESNGGQAGGACPIMTAQAKAHGHGKKGAGVRQMPAMVAQITAWENSPKIRPRKNGLKFAYKCIPPYRTTPPLISHAMNIGNQNTLRTRRTSVAGC